MSLSLFTALTPLALSLLPSAAATTYPLLTSHAGQSFFDGWTYATGYDNSTNGDVFWGNASSGLTYITSDQTAIIKVDNTTTVPWNDKRYSIKLLSDQWYKPGVVMVMDAVHIPTGCSVWPSWWTTGTNWPVNGEIDILETINTATTNQYALHSNDGAGCTSTPISSLGGETGQVGYTTCDQDLNDGSGCTVIDNSSGSAGAPFNSDGGGVWVMQFETSGIAIWFFTRQSIPSSLSSNASQVDTSTLGTPSASYANTSCDISTLFGSQQMVLDITLCGDYAGSLINQTCPVQWPNPTCYLSYVLNSSYYSEAYFEINYLNVYGPQSAIDTSLSTSSSSSSSSASSSATSSGTRTSKATTTTTAGTSASGSTTKSGAAQLVLGADRKVLAGLGALAIGLMAGVGMIL